jgi:hypothetical protein
MLRIILQYILPLAFPLALYLVWALYHKKKNADSDHLHVSNWPWLKLSLAGVALMVVTLVAVYIFSGFEPGGTYHPPVYKDGQVIPGHVTHDD